MKRSLTLVGLLALVLFEAATTDPGRRLYDLGDFIVAGRAASLGLNPYEARPELLGEFADAFSPGSRNVNPPISIPLFQLIAPFDPDMTRVAVLSASIAAYTLAVLLLDRRGTRPVTITRLAWAFAVAGLWQTLSLGQVYTLLALLAVVAWLLIERGRLGMASILIGALCALKPNFLVVPALLFAAGHRRMGGLAGGVFVLLWLLPIPLYGTEIYPRWLAVLPSGDEVGLLMNASLVAEFARLGALPMGYALSGMLLVSLAVWVSRRQPTVPDILGIGLIAAILASPVGYSQLHALLLPVFLSRARWGWALSAAAVLMLVPLRTVWDLTQVSDFAGLLASSAYFVAYGLVLLTLVIEQLRPTPAAPQAELSPSLQSR